MLGQIDFVSSDSSTGSSGTQARIKGVYEDNGDSSGIAFLTGNSTGSGSPTINEVMRIRHEGNVGIGTASPASTLTVAHASGSDGRGIRLVNSSNNQTYETRIGTEGIENTSYSIRDMTADVVRFSIDSSGRVTTPSQPAFHAYGTGGSWVVFSNGSWTKLVLNATPPLNIGSHYDSTNSKFVAPVAGVYHFYYKIYGRVQSGAAANTYWQSRFQKNNNAIAGYGSLIMAYLYNGSADETATYSMTISLAASDEITVHAISTGSYNGEYYPPACEFGGHLVG